MIPLNVHVAFCDKVNKIHARNAIFTVSHFLFIKTHFWLQVPGCILPADKPHESTSGMHHDRHHLGGPNVHLHTVDSGLCAKNLHHSGWNLCNMHSWLEEHGEPEDVHSRGSVSHLLPHTPGVYCYILLADWGTGVQAQSAWDTWLASREEHQSIKNTNLTNANRSVCYVRIVLVASLLHRTAHSVWRTTWCAWEDSA